jgi:hypothetical protein
MCCFSKPVEHVSKTKIFARSLADGRQALVYSMRFAAAGDLAMILPLPVPARSPEDALRFISLEGYDDFFDDLNAAFPVTQLLEFSAGPAVAPAAAPQSLVVHEVGDFEASFVPELADFARVDARFVLSPEVWQQLPGYADWGFAVFKLRGEAKRQKSVHPMAFELPRRDPRQIFFPTVHVHDGAVHAEARFDHVLYCQLDAAASDPSEWDRSDGPLDRFVDLERAAGLVDGSSLCFRRELRGLLPNRDQTLVAA